MSLPDPNATNNLITEPFGSSAGGSYITLPIPVPSQTGVAANHASFTDGFPPSTMTPEASGGLPPFGQEVNGILYMLSANIAALAAGSLPSYNAARSSAIGGYQVGAIVRNTASDGYWLSTVNNNTTNPDSGGAGWTPILGLGAVGAVSVASGSYALTPEQYGKTLIELTGTLSANLQLVFPAGIIGTWIIVNNMSVGSYTVTAGVNGGSNQVTIPATGPTAPTSVFADGTNLYPTGISTAGLAPLASPAFTGTPTAPTATPATAATTQIANTNFVQGAIAAQLSPFAPKASPGFTGVPTAPTATAGTNTTQLATTAFVAAAVAAQAATVITRSGVVSLTNGSNSVAFSSFGGNFPNNCTAVVLTPIGAGATYYLTALPSKTGFQVNVGVTQSYSFIATGN